MSRGPGGSKTMLFKAREKPTLLRRIRLLLWPRTSFARSARYVWKRLFRLKATPHRIAVGCAAGVFASITPLIGVQMLMAGLIAIVLRGSLAAAMLATFVGNPLSWPFIWGATYAVGAFLLGSPGAAEAAPLANGAQAVWPVIYTMLIGSIPVGLIAAFVSYGLAARAVEAVRGGSAISVAGLGFDGRKALGAAKSRFGSAARQGQRALDRIRQEFRAEPSWRLW